MAIQRYGATRDQDLDALATTYAEALARAGAAERERLREDFVVTCLPFAGRLALRYAGRGEPFEDIRQAAGLGLVKAINRYVPERGSFTAYAIQTVYGEIKRHFRDKTWTVHVVRRVQDLRLEARAAQTTLTAILRREPTSAEVAAHLNVPIEDVDEALRAGSGKSPRSLNAPASSEGTTEVGDLLGGADADLESVDDHLTLAGLLRRLPAREQRMLTLRFHGNLSQAEIAADLGISQMHVSRLLSAALAWLRESMVSDVPPPWPGGDAILHTLRLSAESHLDTLVVRVHGEVDMDNAGKLRAGLHRAMSSSTCRIVVVDLWRVPLIDAAGLSVLLDMVRATAVAGRELAIVNVQPLVAQVIATTRLDPGTVWPLPSEMAYSWRWMDMTEPATARERPIEQGAAEDASDPARAGDAHGPLQLR
jgi:RNA polymerase sigma-B factor